VPELPDVEVFRRHVAATSLHREVDRTSVSEPKILEGISGQELARRLKGERFEHTHRYGKYLLLELAGGGYLVLHFGMTGRPQYLHKGDAQPQHTRALFVFANGSSLAFVCQRMFGNVHIVESIDSLIAAKDLGPDALEIEQEEFSQRIAKKSTEIKSALMDQSVVAGIGNVYSDEILFQHKLDPRTRLEQLSQQDLGSLYSVAQRVLKTAIHHHAESSEMPRGYLLSQRNEMTCPECDGKLEKVSVGGRNAIFCPRCQQKK